METYNVLICGILTFLLIPLAKSDFQTNTADSMNAILIKCPKNSSNKSCETQLIVNIHMNPSFDLDNSEKFWVVDKVYEPSKGTTSKIISPYLIVLSRGEPVVMYPLQYFKTIDHEKESHRPSEEVNYKNPDVCASCAKELQLETTTKRQEISNASRLKRNHFPGYARGKAIDSHFFSAINNEKVSHHPSEEVNYRDPDVCGACAKELQLETTTKRQEISNASRLKRNHFPGYARGKAIVSHFFSKEKQEKPLVDQIPKDIASLGLVRVMDSPSPKSPETRLEFSHVKEGTHIFNYDTQDNNINSHQNPDQENKVDDRSRNSQVKSDQRKNLKQVDTFDKSYLALDNKDLKTHKNQHHENRHEEQIMDKNPDQESVSDYILLNRLAQEERLKNIQKEIEGQLSHGNKYKTNDFESDADADTDSHSDLNDIYQESDEQFNLKSLPNRNHFSHEKENGKLYSYPTNIGPATLSKNQHFNYQPIAGRNELTNEWKIKDEKNHFNFKAPESNRFRVDDLPHEWENNENDFKSTDYSLPNVDGFSNALTNNFNFKEEKLFKPKTNPYKTNVFAGNQEKQKYNNPIKGTYTPNDFPLKDNFMFSNLPQNNDNDFSWSPTQIEDDSINSIINYHLNNKLTKNFDSQHDFNSKYYLPTYSDFSLKHKIKPFPSYSKTNYHRSLPLSRSKNIKRIKRSQPESQEMENQDGSRFDESFENNPSSSKKLNAENIEDNNEIPCDTCGGKNKKKDEKPKTIYSQILEDSKSVDSEIENINLKLNDPVPCDTCGGKNKKPGGKPLPGGLPPEINPVLSETEPERVPDYLIPCERCRGNNKCIEGNLDSASCGCITNPSECNCESSKSSRALNESTAENLGYTVFNIKNPVPFLTTKLRVFRRRHNTWWRIAPIITVDSLSGIYANKDLSAVFTSHVDLIRLEKASTFLNRKLAIPKSNDNLYANKRQDHTINDLQNNIGNGVLIDASKMDLSIQEITSSANNNREKEARMAGISSKGIEGLGYLPITMNALENCPHKDKNLCLNIRQEKVPEFSIKVKIPFRENALVTRDKHIVKISRIVTDATTKDALQISIDVINKGFEAQEFSIFVCNCDLSKSDSLTTRADKLLKPDIGQTVNFLLPLLISSKKSNKFSCDVVVKANELNYDEPDSRAPKDDDFKVGVVAKRSMDVKCHSRCFCIWRCRCHCIGKLETFINYNACDRMDPKSEKEAGLIYNCPPGNEKNDVCIKDIDNEANEDACCNLTCKILAIALLILALLFLLGILKAILGICIQSIGRCGFDTVQPGRSYACTSCLRIFLVNCFFFLIFPFACWCKLFRPKPKDLIDPSSDWSCMSNSEDEIECSCEEKQFNSKCRLHGGQDQSLHNNLVLAFAPLHENGLFKDEKSDDEESHLFILEVLEESKHSLNKMMSQASNPIQNVEQSSESNVDVIAANELVDSLKNSQAVYRTMSSPVGGVINIPENYQYCIKGFFLPTVNSTYEFMSYHPLSQFVGISEKREVTRLPQPQYIYSDEFSKIYADKMEVYRIADLSVVPPLNVPCINIDHWNQLENSFVKLSNQQEQLKASQT